MFCSNCLKTLRKRDIEYMERLNKKQKKKVSKCCNGKVQTIDAVDIYRAGRADKSTPNAPTLNLKVISKYDAEMGKWRLQGYIDISKCPMRAMIAGNGGTIADNELEGYYTLMESTAKTKKKHLKKQKTQWTSMPVPIVYFKNTPSTTLQLTFASKIFKNDKKKKKIFSLSEFSGNTLVFKCDGYFGEKEVYFIRTLFID